MYQHNEAIKKEKAQEGFKFLRDSELRSKFDTRNSHYFEITSKEGDSERKI
jgi:hypothetical protein